MIIEVRSEGSIGPGTIDIYPGIAEKGLAAFSKRFTILLDGSIYFDGRRWTQEQMEQEWQRVRDIQEAFDVAVEIVKAEHVTC